MGNTFGTLFRVTTWGESHGPAIGVVIDGCPAGLPLTEEDIQKDLDKRKPGNALASPRAEKDKVRILSGLFEGKTTGAPLSLMIENKDVDSSAYEPIKNIVRPGHANSTYLAKYGLFDYRGGGRASGRETACRVAAGAIAKKILQLFSISFHTRLVEAGGESDIEAAIRAAQREGDSIGGIIELITSPLPIGLGDPVFDKLEANIAKAVLSIPASKGIEFGSGFAGARMKGSEYNDLFINGSFQSNNAGGTLGGISNGMPLHFRAAFKPTSSIKKDQASSTLEGEATTFSLPSHSRHDPCLAMRAVIVVEAMTALVLVDALLRNETAKLTYIQAT